MEEDYFSIDAILAENQVCTTPHLGSSTDGFSRRKFNARSNTTFPTWDIWAAVQNVMYASFNPQFHPILMRELGPIARLRRSARSKSHSGWPIRYYIREPTFLLVKHRVLMLAEQ